MINFQAQNYFCWIIYCHLPFFFSRTGHGVISSHWKKLWH